MTELAKGTQIPEETLQAILEWYQYRRVSDNDRFPVFFHRQLAMLERQYLLLLRNDMTSWDPMVADYMERQILSDEAGTSSTTNNGTQSTTRTGDIKHTTSGQDVVDSEGTSGNTRTLKTSSNTEGGSEQSGTDTVTMDSTRKDDLTHTRNTTDTRTDATQSTSMGEGMENEISDNKHLEGVTPDSKTYGTGSSIGLKAPAEEWPAVLHEIGAPEKLDWKYTGGQSEDVHSGDRVSRDSSTTTNTGTVTTTGTGDTKDEGTVKTEGKQSTDYGRNQTDHSETKHTGTIGDEGKSTGKTTTQYGRILTDTHETTDSTKTEGTQTGDTTRKLTQRERYSGRHAAPPELLQKAQAYVTGSNSLKWLIDRLETCFFQVYEAF